MNKKHLAISAVLSALLSVSASGFAQDRDHDHDRGPDRGDHRDDHQDQMRGGGRPGDEGHGGGDHHWDGAGPGHDIRRGGRLPAQYRNNQYVVSNYREHNLRAPPRGYHWVQTGGDYVLAAVATGVITDLIINSR